MHRLKPAGSIAWDRVASEYEKVRRAKYPPRDGEQLKRWAYLMYLLMHRRWKKLVKDPRPTGSRECPADVRYAKR